jgi:hypothetical protein
MEMKRVRLSLGLLLICAGCEVQRSLTVQSNPPGALVFLNDQEIGRTPVTRNFKWYGTYDVEVRDEGYETLRTKAKVWAPWWQVPPIDLVAVFIPGLEDHHDLTFTLQRPNPRLIEPQRMIRRGEQLQSQLESPVTTQPAAKAK